ncbi:HpcH/HpaI aldolase/citrate lyase family protein [Ulvibacter litoralis]|uniref:Citrate lyase beta subunit n=1 Tax=Ulvibacter litoralis TaxID=227084 RepID=A0A1G7HMT8_9FLAO|nr:aldolase/citrate lyase family protein [Ulvibacter litoralis]GHC58382.1 citrate lyase subunit beta [Ulvibacter litoralis]SDF01646.1 Citrate lyase beta subunit [Ulvibacter litoralis]
MLDTYFFIPGDKQKYLDKIDVVKSDYIVIDLEDAVALKNKNEALELVLGLSLQPNCFVRIPFFENCYSNEQVAKLIQHFEGRIAVPKLSEKAEITQIKNLVPEIDLNMIILVENPLCIINLVEIMKSFSSQIHGIGFGTHDFCSITGMKHTSENLDNYKRQLLLYAKAFNVNYIDGVDLDLKDFTQFKKECVFAFEMGASGKFLIHPKQIEKLREVAYLSDAELDELHSVYEIIKDIPDNMIEVYTIGGKVYEKPHIMRIKKVMRKIQEFSKN